MLQTPDQLYGAVGSVIDGQEATNVMKVLIFSLAECLAQLTKDEFDAKFFQEVQFMTLQSYIALCKSETPPTQ